MEKGAVDGFTKVSDTFVEHFFTKDGETVEEAKARLAKTKEHAPSQSHLFELEKPEK